jgi:ParB family chromosome partitioning protein
MKIDLKKPWSGRVPVESVCRNPEQPRVHFDTVSLDKLGASMKRRQQVPCPVLPHHDPKRPEIQWMLIDGERRWRASQRAKLETLWIAYDPGVTAENIHECSLAANFNREGHTKMDTAKALQREIDAGKTAAELAAVVGKSEAWVSQHLLLMKLDPVLQELLDPPTPKDRQLRMAVAVELARRPLAKQQKLYNVYCQGRSETEAVAMIRAKEGVVGRGHDGPTTRKTDDARYVLNRIKNAFQAVRELNALGTKVLNALDATKAAEGLEMLARTRSEIQKIKDVLEAIAG